MNKLELIPAILFLALIIAGGIALQIKL